MQSPPIPISFKKGLGLRIKGLGCKAQETTGMTLIDGTLTHLSRIRGQGVIDEYFIIAELLCRFAA